MFSICRLLLLPILPWSAFLATICVSAQEFPPQLVLQDGHRPFQTISAIAVSSDGQFAVTGSSRGSVILWDLKLKRQLRTFYGIEATEDINVVSISPDNRTVSASGYFANLRWELSTGTPIRRLGEKGITAFSQDGKFAVAVQQLGEYLLVYDMTGTVYRRLPAPKGQTFEFNTAAAFSPDGRLLAVGAPTGGLMVWDLESGKPVNLGDKGETASAIAFTPNSRSVLSRGKNEVSVWDISAPHRVFRIPSNSELLGGVAFSLDGRLLALADGEVARVFDAATGAEIKDLDHGVLPDYSQRKFSVASLSFLANDRLLTGDWNGVGRIWDIGSRQIIGELRCPPFLSPLAVAFSPDRRHFAIAGSKGTIRLWDMDAGRQVRTLEGHTGDVHSIAFSRDGNRLLSGASDRTARLWDVRTGEELQRLAADGEIITVALSPDGKYALTGGKGATLWNLGNSKVIQKYGVQEFVYSVAFSRNARTILISGTGKTAIYDFKMSRAVRSFGQSDGRVTFSCFSPNGQYVLTSESDNIVLWNVKSGQEIRRWVRASPDFWDGAASFSPDGELIITGSWRETLIASVATGREIRRLKGHRTAVVSPKISPDGRFALTLSGDGTVKLWDVQPGQEIATISSLEDGTWILTDGSGHFDGTIDQARGVIAVQGTSVLSQEELHRRFFIPQLLPKVIAGIPLPIEATSIANPRYPKVSAEFSEAYTVVTIHLENQGSGIGKISIVVDGREFQESRIPSPPPADAATADLRIDLKGAANATLSEHSVEVTVGDAVLGQPGPANRFVWRPTNTAAGVSLVPQITEDSLEVIGSIPTDFSSPKLFMKISSDDQVGITAGRGKKVDVWDIRHGGMLRSFQTGVRVSDLASSGNGHVVLTVANDYDETRRSPEVHLWDTTTGWEISHFKTASVSVSALAVSPDGLTIAVAEYGKGVWIRNLQTGQQAAESADENIHTLAFSPDGRQLISISHNGSITAWSISTNNAMWVSSHGGQYRRATAFSPDGSYFASDSGDGVIHILKVRTGQDVGIVNVSSGVEALGFSHDSRRVVVALEHGSLQTWDPAKGIMIEERSEIFGSAPKGFFAGYPRALAFSHDGTQIIDDNYHFWSLQTGKYLHGLGYDALHAVVANFSSDGAALYLNGFNCFSEPCVLGRKWSLTTGREEEQWDRYDVPSPDGIQLLRTLDDQVAILRADDDENPVLLGDTPGAPKVISFSSDGKRLLTGRQIWDTASATLSQTLGASEEKVDRAVLSADGKLAVISPSGAGKSCQVWDVTTNKSVHEFYTCSFAVAFSPDGQKFIKEELDDVQVFNVRNWLEIRRLQGHAGLVRSATFSKDGENILTASEDGTARLWNAETGALIHTFEGHQGALFSAIFTPDNRFIVTLGADDTIKFWSRDGWREVATLMSFKNTAWAVVSPAGRFDTNALDGWSPLQWVAEDSPMRSLPLEIFMRDYYTPRLLPRILAGENLPALPSIARLNRTQPMVEILGVTAHPESPDRVTVTVKVSDVEENAKHSGARDLRLSRNGQLVAFKKGSLLGKNGELTLTFPNIQLAHNTSSDSKETVFSAYAFNVDGVKSQTAAVTYQSPKPLEPKPKNAFLVAIGVNKTSSSRWDLKFAAADARKIADALQPRLQASFASVHVFSLISDESSPNGASKAMIRQRLSEIAKAATPDDTFFLSFSGHGYADPEGRFYLFPSDLKASDNQAVTPELLSSGISSDELADWLRPVDAGEIVMIIDACHSAASVEGEGFKPGPMGSRGLGQLSYDKRIRILAATQTSDPAWEDEHLGQGLLSYALVHDGLEKAQADWQPKDKQITLAEWLKYAVKQVPRLHDEKAGPTRGFAVPVFPGAVQASLQQPALFDFSRATAGLVLQQIR